MRLPVHELSTSMRSRGQWWHLLIRENLLHAGQQLGVDSLPTANHTDVRSEVAASTEVQRLPVGICDDAACLLNQQRAGSVILRRYPI